MSRERMLQWYHTQYPESSFDGRYQIGYRKANSTSIYPLVTQTKTDLLNFIENMYICPDYDYYITCNSISGVERNSSSLFSLDNIVLDIDNHTAVSLDEELIHEFLWRFQRDKPDTVPYPSSVVRTGRGIQLWWSILPVHVKCKKYYHEVRNHFVQEIKKIMDEYSQLSILSLDTVASCNDIGYFRLPETINSKNNNKISVEVSFESCPVCIHTLVEEIKKVPSTKMVSINRKTEDDFLKYELDILKNIQTLAFFRIKQLISLRKIRNNDINDETRNNFNFMFYNTLIPCVGEKEAWKRLISFNSGFKIPMNEHELQNVIISAQRKGGYKYSNQKFFEFLSITAEEQDKIGCNIPENKLIITNSSHPARDEGRRLIKENRDKQIQKLSKKGKNIKEIAEILAISPATISKKLQLSKTKKDKREQVYALLEQGISMPKIAQETALSLSTVKRLKTAISS